MAFDLSPEQQRVIDYRGGHLQVISCAGSGKTESNSRRVAALIGEGVHPQAIIAFTFTEKAAAEVNSARDRDRLRDLCPAAVSLVRQRMNLDPRR